MKAIKINNIIIPTEMLQEWILSHIEGSQLIDIPVTKDEPAKVKPTKAHEPTKRILKPTNAYDEF